MSGKRSTEQSGRDDPQTSWRSRLRRPTRPRSMSELVAMGEGAVPFLKENAVKGAQCIGAQEPLLWLEWNEEALGTRSTPVQSSLIELYFGCIFTWFCSIILFVNDTYTAAATAYDATFTKEAVQWVLAQPPPPHHSPIMEFGGHLYLYPEHEDLQGALEAVFSKLPWTRHGDPSHAAVGDIVLACVEVNLEKPARGAPVFKTQRHRIYYNL